MTGIKFDFVATDSFTSTANKILKSVQEVSANINRIGKNVSFDPLLKAFDKLVADFDIVGVGTENLRKKMEASFVAISESSDTASVKQKKYLDVMRSSFGSLEKIAVEKLEGTRRKLEDLRNEYDRNLADVEKYQKMTERLSDPERMKQTADKRAYLQAPQKLEDAKERQQEIDETIKYYESLERKLEEVQKLFQSVDASIAQQKDSQKSLRQELREVTKELESLVVQYNLLSEEEKNSGTGREMRDKIVEMTEKTGELRRQWNGLRKDLSSRGSNTRAFDAIADSINLATSSIGAVTGVMSMFGAEEEELVNIQTQLQASLAISNALTVIQNKLRKESAVMIGVETLQKKAATIAENIETAAKGKNIAVTAAATVAQKAFNLVAKANPYILLATAIIGVVSALAVFVKGTNEAKKKEEELAKAQEETEKRVRESREAFVSASADAMNTASRISYLQEAYQKATSEIEKTDVLKQAQVEFNKLGIECNSLTRAQEILVNQGGAVVEMLRLQGTVAALSAIRMEAFKKSFNMLIENGYEVGGAAALAGSNANVSALDKQIVQYTSRINNLKGQLRIGGSTSKKTSPGKTDDTAEKKAQQEQKLFDLEQKEKERRAKEERELEEALSAQEIAVEKDIAKREMMQREKDYQEKIAQANRQAEEWKKANYEAAKARWEATNTDKTKTFSSTEEGKAGWEGQSLNVTQLATYNALLATIEADRERLLEERKRTERQAINEFLKEYGDYEQKRLAIAEEYDKKIEDARMEGERMSLAVQKSEALKAFDAEQVEKTMNFEDIFNNLEFLSLDKLQEAKEMLKGMFDTGHLGIDEYKVAAERISKVNDAIVEKRNKEKGLLSALIPAETTVVRLRREQAEALDRQEKAIKAVTDAQKKVEEQKANIESLLESYGIKFDGEINTANADKILAEVSKVWGKDATIYKSVQEGLEGLAESVNDAKNATENKKTADEEVESTTGKLGEALSDLRQRVGEFAKSLETINANIQSLPGLMDELGLGGTKVGEKVGQVASMANNAMGAAADFASGNYVGAALKAVSAVKDFGRVLGIGGGNAAEINKQLEKLSDRNEILTKSIDRLTDAMSNKGGVGAIRQYEKLAELQKELEANLLKQMQLQMSYHEAHGSFNSYWGGFTQQEIDQFNRRNGTDWSGDLNDLTADIAAMLEADADLWQKIKDTGKGGYGGRVADWISQLADQAGRAKEQTDALYASLTGGTSRDSVFDDFLNSLYDLADGSEDVMDNIAKNWQSMVNKMVINNLIGEDMREKLSDWYTQLAELNRQRTDGLIDDDEYLETLEMLKTSYTGFVEDGKQQIEQFTEMGIIQPIKDAANEVESIFGNLHDTILNDLTDLEMTGEAFARKLNEAITKQLIDKLIFNEEFNKWLEDWENRYNDAVSGETPDEAAIDQLLAEMTEKFDEAAEKAQALRDRLKEIEESVEDTTFKDMGDAWLNTLMDMNKTAEDWSEEIGRTMAQKILSEVVATQYLQPLLDRLQDEFNKSIKSMNGDVSNIGWIVNNGEIASIIEEMKAQFPEMQQLVKNIFDAFGVGLEDTREGFSNLPSFLISALTDMESDAKSLGADIAKSLMEQMLNTIVSRKYAEWMDGINERWKAILAGESNETWEDIQRAVEELYSAIGNDEDVTKLVDGLKGLQKESDTTFKGMADTFMSALMNMEADAESLGKEIGNVLAQKIIEEMIVGKQLQPFLDSIQKAFDDAMSVDGATPDSIIEAMKPAIDDATSAFEDMQPVVKAIMDSLGLLNESVSTPFDNMRDSMLSALMDMENGVENFAKNLNNIITQSLIDKFVLGDAFNDKLEEWKAQYAAIMGNTDMDEETRARQLKQLQSIIQGYSEQMRGEAQAIHELMGTGQFAADQQATMNMSDKATYEQMDQYLGTQMGIYIATEQGNLVRQQILQTLQAMSGITSPNNDAVSEINGKLNFTNEYLLAIRNSNSAILSLLTSRLNSIDSRLNKVI